MTQLIDGAEIPASMAYRGRYVYSPPAIIGQNGRGRPVTAGPAAAVWVWSTLTQAEWDWWALTMIGGVRHYLECDLRIFNQHNVEANFLTAIVERPSFEKVRNGLYWNVQIRFLNLYDTTWYFDDGHFFDDGMFFS